MIERFTKWLKNFLKQTSYTILSVMTVVALTAVLCIVMVLLIVSYAINIIGVVIAAPFLVLFLILIHILQDLEANK